MLKNIVVTVAFLGGSAFAAPAPTGAFGIAFGTPIAKLNIESDRGPNLILVRPPLPHPMFDQMTAVVASSSLGVCKIFAMGDDIDGDSDGTRIRRLYAEVKADLIEKYGAPLRDTNYLKPGSSDYAYFWSEGIKTRERIYETYWGDDLIHLEVEAGSDGALYLSIEYLAPNYAGCIQSIRSGSKAAL